MVSRKGKRARTTANAWFFGLVIPAVLLFMIFSLLPYDRLVSKWPLGIRSSEVMAYQHLFDHRPGQHREGRVEVFDLRPASGAGEDQMMSLNTAQGTYKVTVHPLVPDGPGLSLTFPDDGLFLSQRAMVLIPASLSALVAKYAQIVADSLAITTPPIDLIQLVLDGQDKGPYLRQERIDEDFLLDHAPWATVLLSKEGSVPGGDAGGAMALTAAKDRSDTTAMAALGLLAYAEQREDLLAGSTGATYDRVSGCITPLYRIAYATDPLKAAIPGVREAMAMMGPRILALASALRTDSALWAKRFLAIDSAWLPALAQSRTVGLVQAEVDRTREVFMQRLFHPDPVGFIGPATPATAVKATGLDPWLVPFKTANDTLRFVRGKYQIDHDLVIPKGMALVLERGTRWYLAAGVSVVVNGELHVRGTDLNPVFLRPEDESQPFGVLAVNGNGDDRVDIRGLHISGGSHDVFEGIRYDGMLTIHRAAVQMDHCSFGPSQGPASLVVRRSKLAMNDCDFEGAVTCFTDMAEVHGSIERCAFAKPSVDTTSTGRVGVHLRASHILMRSCTFSSLPFIALRIDQGTEAMVTQCTFVDNTIALFAADGSTLHVDRSVLTGNGTAYMLRRERTALGGALLTTSGNTLSGDGKEVDADAASTSSEATSPDPMVFMAR